jgi:HK97 family phage major capsid protein
LRYSTLRNLSHDQALAARAELVNEGRSLVDKATAEKRNLRKAEETRFDEIEAEIRALDDFIAAEFGGNGSRALGARAASAPKPANRTLGEWLAGEVRGLSESAGGGQYAVPVDYLSTWFDRLAAESVGLKSGFSVVDTLRDEVRFPKITSDPTATFIAEGSAIPASDPGLGEVVAVPRKVASLTQATNELLMDSEPKALDMLLSTLARGIGLAADKAMYEGDGVAPNVRGLKSVAGIGSVVLGSGNGAQIASLDPVLDAFALLEASNATPTAVVMHPRTWSSLMKLREATGSLKPLLGESAGSPTDGVKRSILGVNVYLSSQLSITETEGSSNAASSIYCYQADQVVVVRREEARIEVDSSRLFNEDRSEVRAISRLDLVVPNTAAVVRIRGVLA